MTPIDRRKERHRNSPIRQAINEAWTEVPLRERALLGSGSLDYPIELCGVTIGRCTYPNVEYGARIKRKCVKRKRNTIT